MDIHNSSKVLVCGPRLRSYRLDLREDVCDEAEHDGQVVCTGGMKDVNLLGEALNRLESYRQTRQSDKCPTCCGREAAG
jgi:hypothetical protein